MKPLIKWSGGKSKEIKEFKHFFPKFDTYVEPFIGGGSVFFHLEFKNNIISDVHEDLINFYTQISLGKASKIFDIVSKWDNEEKVYYYIRDKFIPSNDIEKASVFYYQRKTCFRGMLRYNKKGKFNIPFGRYKTYNVSILHDERYEKLLKSTKIYSDSFEDIFKKYNDEKYFYFIDPPYDSVFKDYGFCTFGRDEQIKLSECFKNTKSKCMIVIGDSVLIRELYKDYIIHEYDKKYGFKIHSKRIGNEIDNKHLVVTNYLTDKKKSSINTFFE